MNSNLRRAIARTPTVAGLGEAGPGSPTPATEDATHVRRTAGWNNLVCRRLFAVRWIVVALSLGLIVILAGCRSPFTGGQPDTSKGRKMVSSWYEYKPGRTAAELKPMADILESISVYGDVPPTAFIDQCHVAGIKVYRLMPGAGGCFDTPEHRDASVAEYLRLCREVGFDGIELDFQVVGFEWRERFSALLVAASVLCVGCAKYASSSPDD